MENNIVLVNPPFVYFPKNERSKYNYCRPPLGLCYLAGYLRKHRPGRDRVRIVDALIEKLSRRQWVELIAESKPGIIGFTVATPTAMEASRMAAELRKLCPGATLVAGGPHATVRPEDLFPAFDIVAIGEGEQTMLEIVNAVSGERDLSGIDGIAYRQDGDIVKTSRREFITPLDNIPPPARELLNLRAHYHSFPYRQRGGFFTTMFTGRGCPNNCYFCGNEALWRRKIRFHSLDYVADELDMLVNRLNMSLIFFDDDDFLSKKSRAIEICETIVKMKAGLKWICHLCASSIDEEVLKIMRRSGCVEAQIGVESGSDGILKNIPKCGDTKLLAEKFKLVKKSGINSWGTFIIGHGDDTRESIMDTINFSIKIDPTYASFIILLPFPGTEAFGDFKKKGYLKTTNWEDYTWHGDPVFEKPDLKAREMVSLRALANKKFYLRPAKLLRLVLHTLTAGSFREMLRNFFAWLSVIK